jgi:hypothetical protein
MYRKIATPLYYISKVQDFTFLELYVKNNNETRTWFSFDVSIEQYI